MSGHAERSPEPPPHKDDAGGEPTRAQVDAEDLEVFRRLRKTAWEASGREMRRLVWPE